MSKLVLVFLLPLWLFANNLPKEVKIATQSIVSTQSLAIAKGFLEEEYKKLGVEVKIYNFDSGRDINIAFASKSIDFGFMGIFPFLIGAFNQTPIKSIYINQIVLDSEALAVKKGTYKDFAQLKGQKIATPFGTSSHFALLNALKFNNLSPKDVTLLDLSPTDILSAWNRGDIKAAYIWDTTLSSLKDSIYLYTNTNLSKEGIFIADVSVAREEVLKKYPKLASAYVKAMDRAYTFHLQNFDESLLVLSEYFKLPIEEIKKQLSTKNVSLLSSKELRSAKYLGDSENVGEFSDTLYKTAEFMYEQKLIIKKPTKEQIHTFIDANFLEK